MKTPTPRLYEHLKIPLNSSTKGLATALLALTIIGVGLQAATVKNFGAIGDGYRDDTAAIRRAIRATAPGSVLRFPTGTYRITSTLKLKSGVTYQGTGRSVLKGYGGTGSGGYLIADGAGTSNVTVSGIVFDGGGLNFGQGGGWGINNITVTNNTFQNLKNQGQWLGLQCGIFLDWAQNINVSNNRFSFIIDGGAPTLNLWTRPSAQANGIRMFHVSHVVIAENTFDYMGQGISWSNTNDNTDMTDVQIVRNLFTRTYRMAIEIQSGAAGHPITGVIIDHNVGYSWINPYPDSFGVSLAAYSAGVQMTNNFWDASTGTYSGKTFGMCFEIDGDSTLVDGNTCVASNNPVGWGTTNGDAVVAGINAVIRNNTFCGGPQTIGKETRWATYQAYNNTFPPCGPVVKPPGGAGQRATIVTLPFHRPRQPLPPGRNSKNIYAISPLVEK